MSQNEARNAVNQIKLKMIKLMYKSSETNMSSDIEDILDDVKQLEANLQPRFQAPNCRRVTREELEALCSASNVVIFPAVA